MFFILIQLNLLGQFILTAVHTHTHVSAALCLLKEFSMLTFTTADNRREELDFRPLRQFHQLIHHLIHRLLFNLLTAAWAVWNSDTRIQQSKIVIYLRHCSHCRSGIAICGFLINGNRGRQPLNALHIRFLHLSEEHARVGRQ